VYTKRITIFAIATLLFSFGYSYSLVNESAKDASITSEFTTASDVNILIMIDHGYGSSYRHILAQFESYGWTITVAGTNETATDPWYCSAPLDQDTSIWEIDDITQYDAVSIMPGRNHDILRTNQTALDLIKTAVDAGVIVSAWCKAVRVLAAADVIDGKNITGHADYADEYIDAGATFNELVPPIIDGNIVTGVRSLYWRFEMYESIASALGVYESNVPEISDIHLVHIAIGESESTTMSVSVTDDTGVESVEINIFSLTGDGERNSSIPIDTIELESTGLDVFACNITDLENGEYAIDIVVEDVFRNQMNYTDSTSLTVSDAFIDSMTMLLYTGCMVAALILVVAYFGKKKLN